MDTLPVVALERQGAAVLAAVAGSAGDRLRLVTEGGHAFDYPEDRLLWRARALRVPAGTRREVAAALRVLRAGALPPPDWEALWEEAPKGVPLDPRDLAGGGEDAAADGRALALAARAHEGAPRFRLDHGRLVAATAEEMREERERVEAERRAREAEEALAALLREGRGSLPEEARPALESLLAWAAGPAQEPPPAATALGLPDPFQALERLDAAGLLPPGLIPPLSRRGIAVEFPRKVLAAVPAALEAPDPAPVREDLRALEAFAVDDAETVEVDDAVSLLRGPGGEPHLVVHISDAAAAVAPGGVLDREARKRASTAYLPDLRVPMLPPDLTRARLSLDAGEEREALSLEVRWGRDGGPEAVRAFRSRVRVTRRLDYRETAEPSGLPEGIRPLLELARAFRGGRVAASGRVLELRSPHLRVRDGSPVLEERGGTGAGDLLVGEAMVTFNRIAAERLREAGAAALWRAQDPPKGNLPPEDDPLFPLKARRLFSPARVAARPEPHAGIGVPCYLQATSPIRRYSDLVHQRQLAALVDGLRPPHGEEEVRAMAADLYRREREVRQAEAEREAYWMAVLLEGRREETFEGWCSRAPVHGRGHAWIPALLGEYPFRWPKDRARPPAPGDRVALRPGRLSRHRGRVEFEPL